MVYKGLTYLKYALGFVAIMVPILVYVYLHIMLIGILMQG